MQNLQEYLCSTSVPDFVCLGVIPIVIAIKPKAKYRFHAAVILLCYYPQKILTSITIQNVRILE